MSSETPLPRAFLMYAFRYALGRMSYAVGEVADTLIAHRDVLPLDWRQQIVRDITEALDEDRAGMATDREQWERVRTAMRDVGQFEAMLRAQDTPLVRNEEDAARLREMCAKPVPPRRPLPPPLPLDEGVDRG